MPLLATPYSSEAADAQIFRLGLVVESATTGSPKKSLVDNLTNLDEFLLYLFIIKNLFKSIFSIPH